MRKLYLMIFVVAISVASWGQTTIDYSRIRNGPPLPIACAGYPGATTGTYRQECQAASGVRYACNNAAGCTLAVEWVPVAGGSAAYVGGASSLTTQYAFTCVTGTIGIIGNCGLFNPSLGKLSPMAADSITAIQLCRHNGTTCDVTYDSTTGNVGIGTTGPGVPLEVNNNGVADGAYILKVDGTAVNGGFQRVGNNINMVGYEATVNQVIAKSGVNLGLFNSGGNGITIQDSTGNVGIGTTTPTVPFEVNGAIKSTSLSVAGPIASTSGGFIFPDGSTQLSAIPALFIAATTHTMTAPREYFLCSTATTCSVTLPVPAAGYEFCIRSDNNVSTAITLAAITNVYYEKTDRTGWGTVSHSIASTAAVTNQICVVGYDATHYAIMSSVGTWTNTPQ
jgi:hypothetical protein